MPYDVVYADPPWSYNNLRTGGSMNSGSRSKYPTLTLQELIGLPIQNIVAKDSILFLWTTCPLKPEAFQVMKAWGYTYKTTIYWVKTGSLGLGFWLRGQVEELIIGIRGKIKPFHSQIKNVIFSKPLEHSQKPDVFRKIIEELTPNKRRIELFARKVSPNWDALGYDLNGADIRIALSDLDKYIVRSGSNE